MWYDVVFVVLSCFNFMFVCLFVCLFVYLFVCLFGCLNGHFFVEWACDMYSVYIHFCFLW